MKSDRRTSDFPKLSLVGEDVMAVKTCIISIDARELLL
jgi:hypothetical protein